MQQRRTALRKLAQTAATCTLATGLLIVQHPTTEPIILPDIVGNRQARGGSTEERIEPERIAQRIVGWRRWLRIGQRRSQVKQAQHRPQRLAQPHRECVGMFPKLLRDEEQRRSQPTERLRGSMAKLGADKQPRHLGKL